MWYRPLDYNCSADHILCGLMSQVNASISVKSEPFDGYIAFAIDGMLARKNWFTRTRPICFKVVNKLRSLLCSMFRLLSSNFMSGDKCTEAAGPELLSP